MSNTPNQILYKLIDWQEQKIKFSKFCSGIKNYYILLYILFHFLLGSSGFGEKCPATACSNITSPGYFNNSSALTNMYRSTFFKNCRQWAFRKLSIMIWFGWIWFYNNWASIPPGPISNKLIGFWSKKFNSLFSSDVTIYQCEW